MTPLQHPQIESRRATELLVEMVRRIPGSFPDWKRAEDIPSDTAGALALTETNDVGMAMLRLAAHMGEVIANQVNRIPEKNFLAFLEFLGMDLRPPLTAYVPLTFFLSDKAPGDRLVPEGTRVGAAGRDDVIFETADDLLVTRARLRAAYSFDVEGDRYVDLISVIERPGDVAIPVFGDPNPLSVWLPNEHVMYLGHPDLLRQADEAGIDIIITFGLASGSTLPALEWEYSTGKGWQLAIVTATGSPTSVRLKTPDIASAVVDGRDPAGLAIRRDGYWIRAKTIEPTAVTISSVNIGVEIIDQPVNEYLAHFNSTEIDLTKDFLPFGERPKFNDTFYLACQPAFAVPGAIVSLEVSLSKAIAVPPEIGLDWEYWDGDSWGLVGHTSQLGVPENTPEGPFRFSDKTKAFTVDGTIRFTMPPVKSKKENGVEGYWLRVRIVNGDYGQEASYQETVNEELKSQLKAIETDSDKYDKIVALLTQHGLVNTYQYIGSSFDPPSLKVLDVKYSLARSSEASARLTSNGFVYRDESVAVDFQPFLKWPDPMPSLYLGFDAATTQPGMPLRALIHVVQPVYGEAGPGDAIGSSGPPAVAWSYWNGSQWSRLPCEDETGNVTRSGLVKFAVPGDCAVRYLLGRECLWVRASLESGGYRAPPKVAGVNLNSVWAQHGVTFKDQVLGSSNGDPAQVFQLPKTPVLAGQVIEIREPTVPTEADRARIVADEGADAIRPVTDAAGNITEVWVRWHAVATLTLSSASDRHYVLDRASGRLLFGNGVQGRTPPAGKANIVARRYRAGGGTKGNCPTRALRELKTSFPHIDSVTNFLAAAGGADQENVESIAFSGPLRIKSRDRAVTTEDYEWLAREAAPDVAKVRCLALTRADSLLAGVAPGGDPGWVTVIVVPTGQDARPRPTDGLIKVVRDYLVARSAAAIASQIEVIGPKYVPIDVTVTVSPKRTTDAKTVEKRVFDSLQLFLHPLGGGPDEAGWDFGRDIHLSEVAALVQAIDGVDRVLALTIQKAGEGNSPQNRIAIAGDDLPAAGRITVSVSGV